MKTRTACAALASVAGLAAAAGAASAGPGKVTASPDRAEEGRRAAIKLARVITANPSHVRRASFSALPPFSSPTAISTKRFGGFPLRGGHFAIISTGDATEADNPNSTGDRGTSLGGPSVRGSRDVTILRLDLRVPKKASCLSIRFRFLSEEFPEYVNSQYNDAFIAELDESNWNTVSKDDPTVNAPGNFARDSQGRLISVNSVGDTSVTAAQAKGTTYDGATRRLRASTPVTPGRHILYLSLFDQGDREFDSAVFLDKLTLDRRSPCKSGAVPD